MKKFYFINVFCIVLVFLTVICFMSFFPRTYGFADGENREIIKFPRFSTEAYLSGEYTAQISDWYTDSIPYRQNFRSLIVDIKTLYGIKTELIGNNIQHGANDSRPESDIEYSFDDYKG